MVHAFIHLIHGLRNSTSRRVVHALLLHLVAFLALVTLKVDLGSRNIRQVKSVVRAGAELLRESLNLLELVRLRHSDDAVLLVLVEGVAQL